MVCIATVPQGGQPSNRTLLDRVKSVLGTLYSVKKCLLLKFENLTVNFLIPKLTVNFRAIKTLGSQSSRTRHGVVAWRAYKALKTL